MSDELVRQVLKDRAKQEAEIYRVHMSFQRRLAFLDSVGIIFRVSYWPSRDRVPFHVLVPKDSVLDKIFFVLPAAHRLLSSSRRFLV